MNEYITLAAGILLATIGTGIMADLLLYGISKALGLMKL